MLAIRRRILLSGVSHAALLTAAPSLHVSREQLKQNARALFPASFALGLGLPE